MVNSKINFLQRTGVWCGFSVMCDVLLSARFSVEVVVRGYHKYKDIWVAVVGELSCRRETTRKIDLL